MLKTDEICLPKFKIALTLFTNNKPKSLSINIKGLTSNEEIQKDESTDVKETN